jgi:hypothetical protein
MLLREIIAVYSADHTKNVHACTVWKNADILAIKTHDASVI